MAHTLSHQSEPTSMKLKLIQLGNHKWNSLDIYYLACQGLSLPIIEATFCQTRISPTTRRIFPRPHPVLPYLGQVAEMNKKYSCICQGPMVLLIKIAEIDII